MASNLSQMRRVDELEAHLAVKKRELQTLQKEIAERQANLEDAGSNNNKNADKSNISTASGKKLPKPSIGECAVVQNALADRAYCEYLPLYEASNATSALRAAIEVENQQTQILKREIANLTTEYEQTQTRSTKAKNQFGEFKRVTGYSEDPNAQKHPAKKLPSPKAAQQKQQKQMEQQQNNQSQQQNESNGSDAQQQSKATNSKTNNNNSRVSSSLTENQNQRTERENKELADEYILELRKVEEHLKASHLLQNKLETSLKELSRADEVQHETDMKVDLAKNDVLVLEREIALRQAELLDLRETQATCDTEMQKIDTRRVKEQQLLELIHNEFRRVKGEVSDVSEQKRQWEETIKAQDRRLTELRERKEIIDQAIDDHQIKKFVSEYVERVTADRQKRSDEEALISDSVNPSENLSDIISHYADVNMLSPPEEVVPNGVVMLLTSLHDKLAHRVRCKEVLLEEKKSSADALQQRVADLVAERENSEDQLFIARSQCEKEVQSNVEAARQQLAEFRDEYSALKAVCLARQRQERKSSVSQAGTNGAGNNNSKRTSEPLPDMKFKDKKTK